MANETATGGPPQPDAGEKANTAELSPTAKARERAAKVVMPMMVGLAKRLAETQKPETALTTGEKALQFYADVLTLPPFKPRDAGPLPMEGSPLTIPVEDAKGVQYDGTITGITRMDQDPLNGKVYWVVVEGGPDGPEEIPVRAEVLADAQLRSKDFDEILNVMIDEGGEKKNLFGNDEQAALRQYRGLLREPAGGEAPPPPVPDDLLTTLGEQYPESLIPEPATPEVNDLPPDESMAATYKTINEELTKQIEVLKKSIDGLKGKEKEKAQDRLLKMKVAREANGPLGAFYKADALDAQIEATQDTIQQALLKAQRDSLDPIIESADREFVEFLQSQDISKKDLEAWQKIAQDPEKGMVELLQRKDVQKLAGMQERIFGPDFKKEVLDKIIDESHLPAKIKEWAKDPNHLFWILALLLAIPGAVVAGAGVAAFKMVESVPIGGQR